MRPVTILALGSDGLPCLTSGVLLGDRVDALLVVGRIVASLALNALDHLRVRDFIRVKPLMTLNAAQRLVSRLLQLRAVDEKRDRPAAFFHRQILIAMADEAILRSLRLQSEWKVE